MTDKQYRNRIAKIEALEAQVDELNRQADALRAEIKDALGDTEQYTTENGYNIFWKWRKGSERFDTARFKKEHPEMVPAYMTTGKATRSFLITKPKNATA